MRRRMFESALAGLFALALVLGPSPAVAQAGNTITTPTTPMELPVEIEIELAPAASLKQAPLWKELIQLLRDPYAPVVRRPSFTGTPLPPLNVWSLDYNFLTAEPLRLRTSDGETSWDQPGPLFDPDEVVPTNPFNVPTAVRTIIGALVASDDDVLDAGEVSGTTPCTTCGYLLVSNPGGHPAIPEDGTVVAVPAVANGVLQELDGTSTTATVDVEELEIPVNEEDFFRPATDVASVPPALRAYIGRPAAEVLGKALFWDMQIGSDGVQACGSCHFHAGVDNRTRGQLNPDILGPMGTLAALEVKPANTDVVASDFPFRKLGDPDRASEGDPLQAVIRSFDDVMSSMGVSRFKQFVDIPPIGAASFGAPSPVGGVKPLLPDIGLVVPDPVPVNEGLRRVEPRNTPTMHAAAFNLDNFWDGRARFNFNGGSVFGPSDPTSHIFIDPGAPGVAGGRLAGATMGDLRPELIAEDPELAEQPVRIKFSSLGSQSVGPPLSDFEMSFAGRNWAKIGKKMLQGDTVGIGIDQPAPQPPEVVPLANQLVDVDDSVLGPFSNQGGAACAALGNAAGTPAAPGKPGLCISYGDLIRLAFERHYWHTAGSHHLVGAPDPTDPFDGYSLAVAGGPAAAANTNQFRQKEANFSLFFALAVQAYEELLIPDDTPFDRFMDANPLAANGVGQPGEQAVLFPTLVRDLVGGGLTLIPDDPNTLEYDGFGEEELFGFDVFAGGNLTAALPVGSPRNPAVVTPSGTYGLGSNPFTRNARCMLCHLGPEQTDHSINISHGLLKGDAEFEFPSPPSTGISYTGPGGVTGGATIPPPTIIIPAPEPPGPIATVGGLILAEEVEETPQDAVEVEPRGFALLDDPSTPWDDRVVAQPAFFAFGDQGIYNVGVRPSVEDGGRGANDPFGWPLSLAALSLKNIAGPTFEPCDTAADSCVMSNVDPENLEATFEETGGGLPFPGSAHTLQAVNPGLDRSPIVPLMPEYMVPWINGLPAGELHPQIDEMAGFAPNTLTPPNGGPAVEFPEVMFGADVHCGVYDPAAFGSGSPNFGWGPRCPNNQSGVSGNFEFPVHGTWPVPNRVLREGAFKAPPLRNVELTGPYFHTGSYLTLRQVVDFYLRGGDFPVTNAESRDPNIVDVSEQAFGFGRTACVTLIPETEPICDPSDTLFQLVNSGFLVGTFADALPDTVYRYDPMPDTDHPLTPEPATTTQEQAKNALVRFLISLTDPRVKYERAPFDRPQLFVPVDGRAPENDLGPGAQGVGVIPAPGTLAALSSCSPTTPCTLAGPDLVLGTLDDVIVIEPMFRNIPEVGAAGSATPLPNFLGVLSTPGNCDPAAGPISHFCP